MCIPIFRLKPQKYHLLPPGPSIPPLGLGGIRECPVQPTAGSQTHGGSSASKTLLLWKHLCCKVSGIDEEPRGRPAKLANTRMCRGTIMFRTEIHLSLCHAMESLNFHSMEYLRDGTVRRELHVGRGQARARWLMRRDLTGSNGTVQDLSAPSRTGFQVGCRRKKTSSFFIGCQRALACHCQTVPPVSLGCCLLEGASNMGGHLEMGDGRWEMSQARGLWTTVEGDSLFLLNFHGRSQRWSMSCSLVYLFHLLSGLSVLQPSFLEPLHWLTTRRQPSPSFLASHEERCNFQATLPP